MNEDTLLNDIQRASQEGTENFAAPVLKEVSCYRKKRRRREKKIKLKYLLVSSIDDKQQRANVRGLRSVPYGSDASFDCSRSIVRDNEYDSMDFHSLPRGFAVQKAAVERIKRVLLPRSKRC